jgi:cellulose synthase/poly-beta-1,6-N-acetylglucosamine synthase-like glycosyltransferase
MDDVPSVTVLIAARPGQPELDAVAAARGLDYPGEKLEILIARGRQPSAQRNRGLREAKGEWIYFLDDDSMPPADNLRRALPHLKDSRVKILGGPNLCPPDAPMLEQVFGLVMASWLAFGPSRARYTPTGRIRPTSEKELILCNLLARREALLDLDGFDESLYPNEENALMDDLQAKGGILMYDPDLIVHRRPRETLKAFCKMLMTYGRGRAEQFRLHPTVGSLPNFVPPLFLVYLAGVPFFFAAFGKWALAPLVPYGLALAVQAAVLFAAGYFRRSLAATALVCLTHVLYGAGFWRGLFTRLKGDAPAADAEVIIERVWPPSGSPEAGPR